MQVSDSGSLKQIENPAIRKSPLAEFLFWVMNNAQSVHHRWMSNYLRKRGWVVFYLDPIARNCPALKPENCSADCWLKLYEDSEVTAKGKRK